MERTVQDYCEEIGKYLWEDGCANIPSKGCVLGATKWGAPVIVHMGEYCTAAAKARSTSKDSTKLTLSKGVLSRCSIDFGYIREKVVVNGKNKVSVVTQNSLVVVPNQNEPVHFWLAVNSIAGGLDIFYDTLRAYKLLYVIGGKNG